jgi:Cd2+/Zn2+-exporting ATPase
VFWARLVLCGASVLIAGLPVFASAGKALWARRMDENILMGLAAIAAFAIGDFAEGAAVVLFFRAGELLEEIAEQRSRRRIATLAEIRPETALLLDGDSAVPHEVAADGVAVGSILIIAPHARVPLDGVVVEGASTVDSSALTGEAMPREVAAGAEVLSGTINGAGLLKIRTVAAFGDSAASRILHMVEEAQSRKSKTQKLIARFARIYTPAVMAGAALLLIIGSLFFGGWRIWLPKALAFLVASCPCALVLSVPLAYFTGIGAAAKCGVIIKGGTYLDTLATAEVFAFDKTGTLTSGEPELEATVVFGDFGEGDALRLAAICEHYSEHPLAAAIRAAVGEVPAPDKAEEIPAGGTMCEYDGKKLLCGGKRLLTKYGVQVKNLPEAPVYLAVDGSAVAAFRFGQRLREGADKLPEKLREQGAHRVALLTGDTRTQAESIAAQVRIGEVYAELLPEDKLRVLEDLRGSGVIFVGDGVNDTPVLAAADAGVALGLGTQAACEAADIIIVGEDIGVLADCRALCRRVRSVVAVNIVFSLAIKAAVLIWAALGNAPIVAAVFADVGVLALTVMNAGRLLRSKK